MNLIRTVVGRTAISLIGQAATWTSTLLLTVAYGRFLGDARLGELYLAINIVLLIGFPLEFGFNQQLTRDIAQQHDRALSYLANTLLLKVLLWLGLYVVLLLLSPLLYHSHEIQVLLALCGLTLLSSATANTLAASHYALERVVVPVAGNTLEKVVSAAVGFLLLRAGAGVQTMALVLLGASLLNTAWQSVWFLRLVGTRLVFDRRVMRDLLHTSVPFLVYGALGVIYYRLDTVLLSLMASVTVVGWYGAGYRLFDTLIFLPGMIITPIMFPLFARLSATSEHALKAPLEKTMNFLLVMGLPIAMGLSVAAPEIVGFLYHRPEFQHTVPVLQALAPGLVLLYINSALASVLVSTKRERRIPVMAAAALAFNLGLNLLLIPIYHHVGAAVVTSLTELLLLCLSLAFLPSYLWPRASWRVGAKALLASLVMAAVILLLRHLSILVIVPLAALTYAATALLVGTIPREDMRALVGAVRHKAHSVAPPAYDDQQVEEQAMIGG